MSRPASFPLGRSASLRNQIGILVAAICLVMTAPAAAQTASIVSDQEVHAGELVVPLNKSQVLRIDRPFRDISVGNSEVADVLPLTNRSVYVLGKALGTTNLTVYGQDRQVLAVVDVIVAHDVGGLKRRLHEMMPDETIDVRMVNDAVMLSGTVSSAAHAARAVAIAERFAPDQVTNLLAVAGSQQVMLDVRIAEVTRTAAKELGLKPNFSIGENGDSFTFSTLDDIDPTRFAAGLLSLSAGAFDLDMVIDALEENGIVRVLAEPNLIALSGDTATFLAGGEIPIPVDRDEDETGVSIEIEFKEFGVSLAFTPTVLEDGLINLVVAPEVSEIDPNNSITLSGFEIPGLAVRRAQTTVELADGQSFAIAGLLQNNFRDQIRQFPFLSQVPILGALFRSSEYERRETELVIIVTPHLVRPAPAGSLALPTDFFVPPSDTDIFLFGRREAPLPSAAPQDARAVLGAQGGGGVQGTYGHIIQ